MKHNKIIHLFVFILAGIFLSGCWHEDLSECWKGDVVLSITAERFGELPDGPSEPELGVKVKTLQYYLFDKNDNIIESGNVNNSSFSGDHYDFRFTDLAFGDYVLALTANSDAPVSNPDSWKAVKLFFPEDFKADYFTALYDFTLNCECGYADFVKLYRSKGLVQVCLKNLPSNITRARVDISPVSSVCLPDTTYQGSTSVWNETSIELKESTDDAVMLSMDAFPASSDSHTEVILTLYMEGSQGHEVVALHTTLTSELHVLRNQMVGIKVDFNHSIITTPTINIVINPDWDGINGDTDVDID